MGHREQKCSFAASGYLLLFQEVSVGSGGEKELVGPSQGLEVEFIHDGLYRDDVGRLRVGRGLKLEFLDLSQAA